MNRAVSMRYWSPDTCAMLEGLHATGLILDANDLERAWLIYRKGPDDDIVV